MVAMMKRSVVIMVGGKFEEEEVSNLKALECKLFYTIFSHAKHLGKKKKKEIVSKRYFMLNGWCRMIQHLKLLLHICNICGRVYIYITMNLHMQVINILKKQSIMQAKYILLTSAFFFLFFLFFPKK